MVNINTFKLHPIWCFRIIFRVIKSAPGVSATGDVTSKFFVRGGNSDQNVILMNGVPIYNPFHAMGIFSVVDPEVISLISEKIIRQVNRYNFLIELFIEISTFINILYLFFLFDICL